MRNLGGGGGNLPIAPVSFYSFARSLLSAISALYCDIVIANLVRVLGGGGGGVIRIANLVRFWEGG